MTERIAPVPGTGKPFGVPNLVQRCMGAAQGCGTALALLMRVAYWTPRARIWRQGHLWIAKSGDEWRTEAALRASNTKACLPS